MSVATHFLFNNATFSINNQLAAITLNRPKVLNSVMARSGAGAGKAYVILNMIYATMLKIKTMKE